MLALWPITLSHRIGLIPVPGRFTVRFSSVNDSPLRIFLAATILFLAIGLFFSSEELSFLMPVPREDIGVRSSFFTLLSLTRRILQHRKKRRYLLVFRRYISDKETFLPKYFDGVRLSFLWLLGFLAADLRGFIRIFFGVNFWVVYIAPPLYLH